MVRVILSASAQQDIAEALAYITPDSPRAAGLLARRLKAAAMELTSRAKLYPVVLHAKEEAIRRRAVGSYTIYFRLTADRVEVLRILHAARDRTEELGDG